ncbi:pyruvate dehydrogenase E2 component (dihydrolipoamide acetyltransferase) [Geothermobacter ehrlichii]|uniref:Dihydrolipoamide acetyltransferase component of pyruvate dehydrogenase complex n=1 Tax=Geothermobacter ehrlichii TaxID=213224 RepID=A0A5D3WIN1_9BACT|nr:dihydrolipoamide acetyltransferase family protein [Geothermobacter ehrlichii]TYO98092.1 pyruvate dehydrogenase E2 component (dihydrolipoamide acetyltransferase) [Geothermobacter ehrlichii]
MTDRRFEFVLPDLGEGVTEAEIRALHVSVGDRVDEHQTVFEVETDKALVEVPSPRAGIVREIRCAEGEKVAVGRVLLVIEMEGEAAASGMAAPRPAAGIVGVLPEAPAVPASPAAEPGAAGPPAPGTRAMPRVRRLARELEVDLQTLTGSGPQGSIVEADVRATAGRNSGEAGVCGGGDRVVRRIPLTGLRRSIAEHLLEAQRRTAFVTSMAEVDVTRLWGMKARLAEHLAGRGIKLTFLPFFMKAVQHALVEFPLLNARVDEAAGEIELLADCHLGVAVDTSEGLLVPVVRDVGRKSVAELANELQQLAQLAETRQITREQLRGSSFTLTNFGAFGGSFATPVINHPNVGILGFGGIAEKPWVVDGEILPRRILPMSLTFDHRVVDGAEATRFLVRVGQFLEDPELLLVESR